MFRLLTMLLGAILTGGQGRRGAGYAPAAAAPGTDRPSPDASAAALRPARRAGYGPESGPGQPTAPARQPVPPAGQAERTEPVQQPGDLPPRAPRPRRPRRRRVLWIAAAAAAGLVFRRALASVALAGLTAALHLVGISAHLPHISFGWPWQAIAAGRSSSTDLGPWVLQKIEGISKLALGQANFDFLFSHRVSKSIGPWPCWYASTFYAVGRASATVDLNPGPSWWRPSTGHYRLQVISRPAGGKPGQVAVTMVLPAPQLPQSAHDVTIDTMASKPVSVQHSWTYPGLGCGTVLRPQFPESVLYAQAQHIAYAKARSSPQITRPLISTAESVAAQTVRNNFVQPTLNSLGYELDRFTVSWAVPARAPRG